jgi:tRNA1Val (adenine37-N6)-methyltransferase
MNDAKKPAKVNQLFRFKQFSLSDNGCAMKIGTDGVLLGATVANIAESRNPQFILDIGTGCGLIALMAAQKCNARIDAIDIDAGAIAVAVENFSNSPWAGRLNAIHSSLQDFKLPFGQKYDIIVSNPPYFQNSLPSQKESRTLARHNRSLSFEELFRFSSAMLSSSGVLSVIYPSDFESEIKVIADHNNFAEYDKIYIKATVAHKPKRIISSYSNGVERNPVTTLLSIETSVRNIFTDAYMDLTRDFHPFL